MEVTAYCNGKLVGKWHTNKMVSVGAAIQGDEEAFIVDSVILDTDNGKQLLIVKAVKSILCADYCR